MGYSPDLEGLLTGTSVSGTFWRRSLGSNVGASNGSVGFVSERPDLAPLIDLVLTSRILRLRKLREKSIRRSTRRDLIFHERKSQLRSTTVLVNGIHLCRAGHGRLRLTCLDRSAGALETGVPFQYQQTICTLRPTADPRA